MVQRAELVNFAPPRPHIIIQIIAPLVRMVETDFYLYYGGVSKCSPSFFVPFWEVDYLWSHFVTALGLLVWFWFLVFVFWGEGVGELLGYLGVGDSDDVCCGGGEAEEVDVAVPPGGSNNFEYYCVNLPSALDRLFIAIFTHSAIV